MGCVYFVRHGQTVWNVEDKICGVTDMELDGAEGIGRLLSTGKKIVAEGNPGR